MQGCPSAKGKAEPPLCALAVGHPEPTQFCKRVLINTDNETDRHLLAGYYPSARKLANSGCARKASASSAPLVACPGALSGRARTKRGNRSARPLAGSSGSSPAAARKVGESESAAARSGALSGLLRAIPRLFEA